MNKNLILIISIFAFWLYTYLTNIKQEQEQNEKQIANNDVSQVGLNPDTNTYNPQTTYNYIINPVKAKGGN